MFPTRNDVTERVFPGQVFLFRNIKFPVIFGEIIEYCSFTTQYVDVDSVLKMLMKWKQKRKCFCKLNGNRGSISIYNWRKVTVIKGKGIRHFPLPFMQTSGSTFPIITLLLYSFNVNL